MLMNLEYELAQIAKNVRAVLKGKERDQNIQCTTTRHTRSIADKEPKVVVQGSEWVPLECSGQTSSTHAGLTS